MAGPSMIRVTESRAGEVALNRALWTVVNERYTDAAADVLWSRPDIVWGLFAVPEHELGVLGDLYGKDVLEIASGTAYVSAWLARLGANPVAVDLSGEQLRTARRLQQGVGPVFPLIQCDAERLPLADRCVDLIVSEPGAAAWCDPERWLPEAARVRRPGELGVSHEQPPLSPVRAARRRSGGGAAAPRPRAGVPSAVGGRRGGVLPLTR